jgi:hypothetical protein
LITPDEVKQRREEMGTPGGVTYYIRRAGEKELRPLCYRPLHGKPEQRCTNTAGYDTWHLGTGACKFHGGANKGLNITTGRSATITRERLRTQIESYLGQDRKQLLDLSYELASAKAIYDEFMASFPDTAAENYGMQLSRFMAIIDNMSNLVERISKIDNRNALTNAQVLYLRATVADILMKYLSDPLTREKAAKELAARLGGDVAVELRPIEYNSLPGGL